MGSMIRGKSLPKQQLEAFQKAFSKLPYKVLWKWENETMPEKPNNIHIRHWMPQYEVLSKFIIRLNKKIFVNNIVYKLYIALLCFSARFPHIDMTFLTIGFYCLFRP